MTEMLAMSVARMGFLVDRLNRDCAPMQFIRELTKNAMQGIEALPDRTGEIRWDVDWRLHEELGPHSARKLCIIDTGIGMTGPEMVEFINKLSSSIHQQSATGNFGVGSKIAAAPLNPAGMVYFSWKNGQGAMIHLFKDHVSGEYGLLRFDNGEHWQPVGDDKKPDPIGDHGTMVLLLGQSRDDATAAPHPTAGNPHRWIQQYLNMRFLEISPGTAIRARIGWDQPRESHENRLEDVTGMKPWLAANAQSSGVVALDRAQANVHWWILRDDANLHDWRYHSQGHIAALFQGELYEFLVFGAAVVRMQSFGVLFGPERVILYVEPTPTGGRTVSANTARTSLLVDHQALDWGAYAVEFREVMPQELIDYQQSYGAEDEKEERQEHIRDRLRSLASLFRFGGYRRREPTPEEPAIPIERKPEEDKKDDDSEKPPTPPPSDILSLFSDDPDEEMEEIAPPLPEVRWITLADGSRSEHDLRKQAARYLPDRNTLLINGDFKGVTDIIDRWADRFQHLPGSRDVAQAIAREWFEQQLVETVMSAVALKESMEWTIGDMSVLWSEHALTAAILPRWHIDQVMAKAMPERLGALLRAA